MASGSQSDLKIKISSEYDASGAKAAEKSVNDIASAAQKASKQFSSGFSSMSEAMSSVAQSVALGVVVSGLKNLMDAASESEQVQVRLVAALKATGQYSEKMVEGLDAWSTAMMRTKGVDDEAAKSLITLGVSMGKNVEQSKRLAEAAANMGTVVGSTESAMSLLIRASNGSVESLRRYGVQVSEAEAKSGDFESILKRIEQQFSGQAAAAMDTYAGKIQLISREWGNLKETLGEPLIDAVKDWFDYLDPILEQYRLINAEIKDMTLNQLAHAAAVVEDQIASAELAASITESGFVSGLATMIPGGTTMIDALHDWVGSDERIAELKKKRDTIIANLRFEQLFKDVPDRSGNGSNFKNTKSGEVKQEKLSVTLSQAQGAFEAAQEEAETSMLKGEYVDDEYIAKAKEAFGLINTEKLTLAEQADKLALQNEIATLDKSVASHKKWLDDVRAIKTEAASYTMDAETFSSVAASKGGGVSEIKLDTSSLDTSGIEGVIEQTVSKLDTSGLNLSLGSLSTAAASAELDLTDLSETTQRTVTSLDVVLSANSTYADRMEAYDKLLSVSHQDYLDTVASLDEATYEHILATEDLTDVEKKYLVDKKAESDETAKYTTKIAKLTVVQDNLYDATDAVVALLKGDFLGSLQTIASMNWNQIINSLGGTNGVYTFDSGATISGAEISGYASGLSTVVASAQSGDDAATGGAAMGAMIGTAALPGIGTAVGAVLGQTVGTILSGLTEDSTSEKAETNIRQELNSYFDAINETFGERIDEWSYLITESMAMSEAELEATGMGNVFQGWAEELTGLGAEAEEAAGQIAGAFDELGLSMGNATLVVGDMIAELENLTAAEGYQRASEIALTSGVRMNASALSDLAVIYGMASEILEQRTALEEEILENAKEYYNYVKEGGTEETGAEFEALKKSTDGLADNYAAEAEMSREAEQALIESLMANDESLSEAEATQIADANKSTDGILTEILGVNKVMAGLMSEEEYNGDGDDGSLFNGVLTGQYGINETPDTRDTPDGEWVIGNDGKKYWKRHEEKAHTGYIPSNLSDMSERSVTVRNNEWILTPEQYSSRINAAYASGESYRVASEYGNGNGGGSNSTNYVINISGAIGNHKEIARKIHTEINKLKRNREVAA